MGDPIIGKWKMMNVRDQVIGGNEEYIAFLDDGTYSFNFLMSGNWKRLDDHRLELKRNPFGFMSGSTRIVTIKIEGDVLTITEPDGTSSKFRR